MNDERAEAAIRASKEKPPVGFTMADLYQMGIPKRQAAYFCKELFSHDAKRSDVTRRIPLASGGFQIKPICLFHIDDAIKLYEKKIKMAVPGNTYNRYAMHKPHWRERVKLLKRIKRFVKSEGKSREHA